MRHERFDQAQALIDRVEASGDRNLKIIHSTREKIRAAGLRVSDDPR